MEPNLTIDVSNIVIPDNMVGQIYDFRKPGRPRKYANSEEARLANLQKAKERNKAKKDEIRVYQRNYSQQRRNNPTISQ